jgi:hypothetical protein
MDLVLILTRDLAASLATPTFVVDPEGTLIFYNEPAETVLGEKYKDAGELAPDEWGTMWAPEDSRTGDKLSLEELPLWIALNDRRPAWRRLCITGLDGVRREIEIMAVPLIARADELVGAVAIFWEPEEDS